MSRFCSAWASRTLIFRKLKGLEDIIRACSFSHGMNIPPYYRLAVTIVSPRMGENGWAFRKVDDYPGTDEDPLYDFSNIKDLYFKAEPGFSGRYVASFNASVFII